MKINIEIPDNPNNLPDSKGYDPGSYHLSPKWIRDFHKYLEKSFSSCTEEMEALEYYVLEDILLGLESYADILKEKENKDGKKIFMV